MSDVPMNSNIDVNIVQHYKWEQLHLQVVCSSSHPFHRGKAIHKLYGLFIPFHNDTIYLF